MTSELLICIAFDYTLPYTRGILRGIDTFLVNRPNWNLVYYDIDDITPARLESNRPDGIIAHVISRRVADAAVAAERPVVNISHSMPHLTFPRVGIDNRAVGALAFEHLQNRGLRNLALVGHPQHYFSVEREAGFREMLDPERYTFACFYDQGTHSHCHRATPLSPVDNLRDWLVELPKPVGVFACHDVWGAQVTEACRVAALRVPEDVAVICVDTDGLLCERSRPPISSILVPSRQIGVESAALLDRLMSGSPAPVNPLLIGPTGLVTRKSTDTLAGSDPDLLAAVRFINSCTTPIDVNDVLKVVPTSRRSLERKFSAVLDRGIGEEIRRVQVNRAKGLLTSTTLSITEIAQQSGFATVYHLSRVFRRETGVTPTMYRQKFEVDPG
ncbi:substrate-binding domain-containing protein [Planctomicrobium sp. SH664]|uniref:XylR family transcriptional regulator n=1 Tax=Planctomicrobium sp. SH664 TaxID=3448125 RepID=UPI003F5B89D1